jgi:hypothetical protein
MNVAYSKLLSKENQSLPVPTQFLCQFSNISECLPIEGQDSVSEDYLLKIIYVSNVLNSLH